MSIKKIMRKNGSRLISLRQYRYTDLFLFAVILIVFELVLHFAFKAFGGDFTFSPMVPIVLIVMMRLGWPCVFYAVGEGLMYTLLKLNSETYQPYFFAVFIIGNAFIALLLLMTKFMGKERIRKKWYFSAMFLLAGWVSVWVGRVVVAACFGYGLQWLKTMAWDLISLGIGLLIILIVRRLEGMFEDQKHFLVRTRKEEEEKKRRDEFGDEPIDIDEDTISILKRWDDGLDT